MMEYRKFGINILQAEDLEDVRKLFKMEVYARVSIGSQAESMKRTPVDTHGETNPVWSFTINYTISECVVQNYSTMLVIKLYCKRMLGDRYIGELHLSMKELYEYAYSSGGSATVTYPVQKGCVNSQGLLMFSYTFGERVGADNFLQTETIGYGVHKMVDFM
ncbi:hypothetical protein AgCh_013798 [Apium graveolens]